jgi:hypothetical protein
LTERLAAAFGADDPGTIGPRRVVPNVLVVPALELSNPMLLVILVEANDPSVHGMSAAG